MLIDGLAGLNGSAFQVTIIGAGPVGLALAMELIQQKIPTLLLESGGLTPERSVQALSDAQLLDPARHDDMRIAVSRQLGGTSNIWGGRCLPYDPIDFASRDYVDGQWPIPYDTLIPYWDRAAALSQCGRPVYRVEPLGSAGQDSTFLSNHLERWVNIQAAQNIHHHAIHNHPLLEVRTHVTLTGMDFVANGQVAALKLAHSLSGETTTIPVQNLVLAAGGLETTRILLAAQQHTPARFGGPNGPLGRYYMGHLMGTVANIVFTNTADAKAFNYQVDANGSYVRRRIVPAEHTQTDHRLLNSAFWPVVPPISDPRHGSAILSLVYLALSIPPLGRALVAEAIRRKHIPDEPGSLTHHLLNLCTGLPSSLKFAADYLKQRYWGKHRVPGFFITNTENRYGMAFHGEQTPNSQSRVYLSGNRDRLGLPSLAIDLRFCDQDVASLVKTHDLLEDWLTQNRVGTLSYRCPREERHEAIFNQISHGTHQIGLTRMAQSSRQGIVDANLRCFDAANLYLASSSVLPTSGQANPTFTTIALAIRLAEHLARQVHAPTPLAAVGAG